MTAQDATGAPGAVRCSDAEREQTCAALRVAVGEGRLSLSEVEERLEQVYSVRYRHELGALTADLPPSQAASPGWTAIGVLAWQRLRVDVGALTGRGGPVDRRRQVLTALLALAVLVLLIGMMAMALHGMAGDVREYQHFGRH